MIEGDVIRSIRRLGGRLYCVEMRLHAIPCFPLGPAVQLPPQRKVQLPPERSETAAPTEIEWGITTTVF
jgi:hypothetical protein